MPATLHPIPLPIRIGDAITFAQTSHRYDVLEVRGRRPYVEARLGYPSSPDYWHQLGDCRTIRVLWRSGNRYEPQYDDLVSITDVTDAAQVEWGGSPPFSNINPSQPMGSPGPWSQDADIQVLLQRQREALSGSVAEDRHSGLGQISVDVNGREEYRSVHFFYELHRDRHGDRAYTVHGPNGNHSGFWSHEEAVVICVALNQWWDERGNTLAQQEYERREERARR